RHIASLSGSTAAELTQRVAEPTRRFRLRRSELPGGASPVHVDAAQPLPRRPQAGEGVLRRARPALYRGWRSRRLPHRVRRAAARRAHRAGVSRTLAILTPAAGRGAAGRAWAKVRPLYDWDCTQSEGPGHARELAAAAATAYERVVAIGG